MSQTTPKSEHPDWNSTPHFGRRDTILYALRRQLQFSVKPPVIVEFGTSRDARPPHVTVPTDLLVVTGRE
jgi:hypothetical protein